MSASKTAIPLSASARPRCKHMRRAATRRRHQVPRLRAIIAQLPGRTSVIVGSGYGASGWTCAAAAATSQPTGSSRAALRKTSHAMASAPATSVVTTVSARLTRT